MKAELYEALQAEQGEFSGHVVYSPTFAEEAPMGLAPGGRMTQDIYDDPYGLDAWDQRHGSRCFVSLLNTTQWMATTGEPPPIEPPTAQAYAAWRLPWFDYYGGDLQAVAGSQKLRGAHERRRACRGNGTGASAGQWDDWRATNRLARETASGAGRRWRWCRSRKRSTVRTRHHRINGRQQRVT